MQPCAESGIAQGGVDRGSDRLVVAREADEIIACVGHCACPNLCCERGRKAMRLSSVGWGGGFRALPRAFASGAGDFQSFAWIFRDFPCAVQKIARDFQENAAKTIALHNLPCTATCEMSLKISAALLSESCAVALDNLPMRHCRASQSDGCTCE